MLNDKEEVVIGRDEKSGTTCYDGYISRFTQYTTQSELSKGLHTLNDSKWIWIY